MDVVYTFYLLQPRCLGLDNFYKIFITKDSIYGGKISSQFFNEESLKDLTTYSAGINVFEQGIAGLLKSLLLRKKQAREDSYDMSVLDDKGFQKIDKNNFIIKFASISKIVWKKKRSLWTARHNNLGTLDVYLKNKKMRFIVTDQPRIDENIEILKKSLNLEIID